MPLEGGGALFIQFLSINCIASIEHLCAGGCFEFFVLMYT